MRPTNDVIKRGRGRPVGSKDSKPRKTKARAMAMVSTLNEQGIGTGEVAAQNLEMIDYLINDAYKDYERARELLERFEQEGGDEAVLDRLLGKLNTCRNHSISLLDKRQKWVADIAKYTDYTKGQETIVTKDDGEVTTAGDLLAGSNPGPLLEGE